MTVPTTLPSLTVEQAELMQEDGLADRLVHAPTSYWVLPSELDPLLAFLRLTTLGPTDDARLRALLALPQGQEMPSDLKAAIERHLGEKP